MSHYPRSVELESRLRLWGDVRPWAGSCPETLAEAKTRLAVYRVLNNGTSAVASFLACINISQLVTMKITLEVPPNTWIDALLHQDTSSVEMAYLHSKSGTRSFLKALVTLIVDPPSNPDRPRSAINQKRQVDHPYLFPNLSTIELSRVRFRQQEGFSYAG